MITTFFYGLFMDEAYLKRENLRPARFELAYANDFELRIGDRATIVEAPGSRVYGSLMNLSESDLRQLYGRSGLDDYRPRQLRATRLADERETEATCYVLPHEMLAGMNVAYARRLATLVVQLGLPETYAREIRRHAGLAN